MKKEFRNWLEGRGLDSKTIATQLSQANRLASNFGDLDDAFDSDRFERIRATLVYSKGDERTNRPNPAPFKIDGDLYSNLASYRTTLNYYAAFRDAGTSGTDALAKSEEDGTETGAAPPIDLNEASLEKLIARVKERGYVTYDEINEALLHDQMSSEQIEDVMSAFSEMGIKVVENEEIEDSGSVSVEPGGSLFVDAGALEAMRDAFLARFPDFAEKGFEASEGGYWDVERAYKQTLIDGAAKIMKQTDFAPPQVGAALLDLLKDCNLLGWREWRRMEQIENTSLIPAALGEMIAAEDPAEGVGRFVASVAEDYLKGREGNMPYADLRSIPTTVLALARPTEAIAVRYTTMHRAGVRLTGGSLFKNAPMTTHEYGVVLTLARHIEKVMREAWAWRPRDLWDVQGFLWVVTEGPEDQAGGELDDITLEATAERPQDDRYRTQTDDPTRFDELERRPFAAVLAERIIAARGTQRGDGHDDDRAFMVHLQGPWGSGKSTMLNLLKEELERARPGVEPTLVVWFNAWKHQRLRPPWWAFLTTVYGAAAEKDHILAGKSQPNRKRLALRWLWWKWRLRADLLPGFLAALVLGGLAYAIVGGVSSGGVETLLKIVIPVITVAATVTTYARLIAFGSTKAAESYADLTADPYLHVIQLFRNLVKKLDPWLVVFIDDLDRCDADYVVELLEGVQTLFRTAKATYVVAADRKWICASFERRYGDFSEAVGEPCRPLGYLFLDKVFQISVGMPQITPALQHRYLATLLAGNERRITDPDVALSEAAAARVSGITDEVQIQKVIEESAQGSIEEQHAIRAAAALQITSAAGAAATEHRLQKFSHLIERNPRSMKRLVNAVGMAQARGMLDGRAAEPDARARWTMLWLRWPIFAEFIAEHPEAILHWKKAGGPSTRRSALKPDPNWPVAIQAVHGNAMVMAVVGDDGDDGALTPENLAPLVA